MKKRTMIASSDSTALFLVRHQRFRGNYHAIQYQNALRAATGNPWMS